MGPGTTERCGLHLTEKGGMECKRPIVQFPELHSPLGFPSVCRRVGQLQHEEFANDAESRNVSQITGAVGTRDRIVRLQRTM